MRRRLLLSAIAMLPAMPALAQSAPPDLQPKLVGAPLAGKQTAPDEKPQLKEPPRPPAMPDGGMSPGTPPGGAPAGGK